MRILPAIVSLCALGSVAAAAPLSSLEAGFAAYEELDYPRAVARLTEALKETGDRNQTMGILRTRAFALAALDRRDEARADFERLLRLDAGFTLDRTISPRVRDIFDHAQARIRVETASALLSVLPEQPPAVAAPPPPPRRSIARKPWFWVAIGSAAAVVAAATATAVVLSTGRDEPMTTRVLIRAP